MSKCDAGGAAVTLMIWAFAFVIHAGFEQQLGRGSGFVLLILGIVGVWFGMAVRKECTARASAPSADLESGAQRSTPAVAAKAPSPGPRAENVDDAFLQALFGEDQLGMVVRAHIHIEARLNEVIDLLVPYPDQLPRLRYEQRARLACALGLTEQMFAPLKVLGDIRNRFGHKLDTKLTSKMVDELYTAFSDDDRAVLLAGYAQTNKQLPSLQLPNDFSILGARDKFIMMAVALDKMLLLARMELQARQA